MISLLAAFLGISDSSSGQYYSYLVQGSIILSIILFVLVSMGVYRLWKYITKF